MAKKATKATDFTQYDPQKDPKIRAKYRPEPEQVEVLQKVYNRKFSMEKAPDRVKIMAQIDGWYKQWDAWRIDRHSAGMDEWQSNHYVPLTFSVIQAALAEIIDQTPQPLILPRGSEDVPRAQVMKRIFEYTWEVANGNVELFNIILECLITGTAIGQEFYWKDRRLITTKSGEKEIDHEVFDYDDCYMESVRLQDFFVDETARGFTGPYQARDSIRRYIMHIDDFRLFFHGEVWDPFEAAQYVEPGGDTNYYEFYKPPTGIDMKNMVEVLWYYSKKPKDKLIIVANDVLVVDGPNPYDHKQLPFARAVDVKRPHSFYGKGESEILESTQDEMNVMRRMLLDRNHLDIDKMFIVSQNTQLSDEDLTARPHGLIPVDDPNSTKAVEYGDVPRSYELSMNKLNEDSLRATGINDMATSMPTGGTATEAAIVKETTLKRIRMKMRNIEREFLTDIARLRVANIIQFYSQPKLEKIVGEEGTQQYERQVLELHKKGQLAIQDGNLYSKKYKEIRLQDRSINFDATGKPFEQQSKGFSFFEAKPDYFIPVARGGFDIRFEAGSTLPISKPLLQTKAAELYDRVIQVAMGVPNSYDPVKVTDDLVKINDFNPEDWKVQDQNQNADVEGQMLQQQLSLAIDENKMMMQGQKVAPTPFASPAHTRIHAQFMNSGTWQNMPPGDDRRQLFLDHVLGEMMSQQARGTSTGASPGMEAMTQAASQAPTAMTTPTTAGQGTPPQVSQSSASKVGGPQGGSPNLTSTIPALIQGGGQAPVGI